MSAPTRGPTPLARSLFFAPRGLVDLTAASGAVAYADDARGGYYTAALCQVAGARRDEPLGWGPFHALAARGTTATHRSAVAAGLAPALRRGEGYQKPAELGPLPGGPGSGSSTGSAVSNRTAAVVGLVNPSGRPVEFEYRWAGAQVWVRATLAPGGRKSLATWVPRGRAEVPALTVRTGGREQVLASKEWSGREALPRFSDGKIYRLAPGSIPATPN